MCVCVSVLTGLCLCLCYTTLRRPFARSELLLLSVLLYNESAEKYAMFFVARPSRQRSSCMCVCVDVCLRCNKLALGMSLCVCVCVSDAAWQIARLKGLCLAIDKFMILMYVLCGLSVIWQSPRLMPCSFYCLHVCVCFVHALYLFLQLSCDLMPPIAFIFALSISLRL